MTDLGGTLLTLLRADTGVPLGQTEILPGDPGIKQVVDDVVLPILEELEPDEVRRHASGDVAVRFGPDLPGGLLLQGYVVSQHGNHGSGAADARIVDGRPDGLGGDVASGQGASQNKGALAAAIEAVRARPDDLVRPVWLTINTEGRSSHGGSRRILDDLAVDAACGIALVGTDLNVSLGNRGRVDLEVVIHGRSAHSSQPALGESAIESAADAIVLMRSAPLPAPHPHLGSAGVVAYQARFTPVAPHTLPDTATLIVDRRLLPGEKPSTAAADLESWLREGLPRDSEVRIEVADGVHMLPAVVSGDEPVVLALLDALGPRGSAVWSRHTFDTGYACARGIPTVMFGPGKRSFGSALTATETVSLDDCLVAQEVLESAIRRLCT